VKRYVVFIIFVVLAIFFQSTSLYDNINVRNAAPDFILIILCIAAFLSGPVPGEILGFVTGFVVDILSGGLLGLYAFTYTVIGYGVGLVGQRVLGKSVLITITLLFFVTLAKAAILSMFAALFLKPGYFGYFTKGMVFLEAVMNGLIAPLLFLIINRIQVRVAE
jgi:rod shape-determining protein MreD